MYHWYSVNMVKIFVVIGSTREGRFGDKPAHMVFEELKKVKNIDAELIDLRDWPLPLFDEPVSPAFNKGVYKNELARKWADKISEADGYIVVTPEYNHGYSAVLKNAMDYVYKEWNNKAIAFVSYGGSAGGSRAVEQLRLVAVELQMAPIRAGVHIPLYWNQLDENGHLKKEVIHGLDVLFDQLLWWTKALKTARTTKTT